MPKRTKQTPSPYSHWLLQPKSITAAAKNKNPYTAFINTPAFKSWFGASKVVDAKGNPMPVYHGTNHDFDTFSSSGGNSEGHYGSVLYFTSSKKDASDNYTGSGPDLTQRIGMEAEKIEEDLVREKMDSGEFEKWPAYDDPALIAIRAQARQKAKEKLGGGSQGLVMPCYLKMLNPVIVKPKGGTWFETLTSPELDEDGDPIDEDYIDEDTPFVKTLVNVLEDHGADSQSVLGTGLLDDGEITAFELEKKLRSIEGFIDDEIWVGELLADIYERLGYDGIILDANVAFPGMKMEKGTMHYMVWNPGQVKSAIGNSGEFDPDNKSITASSEWTEAELDLGMRIRNGELIFQHDLDAVNPEHREAFEKLMHEYRKRPASPPPPDPEVKAQKNGIEVVSGNFDDLRPGDPDDYYYHVTRRKNVPAILANGFTPAQKNQNMADGFYRDYSKGKVFFCERNGVSYWEDKIQTHMEDQGMGGALAVLRFKKDSVGPLEEDKLGTRDAGVPCYFSTSVVKPKVKSIMASSSANWLPSFEEVMKGINTTDIFGEDEEEDDEDNSYEGRVAKLRDLYEELCSFFSSWTFPKTVYRAIAVKSLDEIRTQNFGIYWTWEESAAESYNAGMHSGKQYVVRAEIDWDAVNWMDTLRANIHYPDEQEVTLEMGAEVTATGIRGLKEKAWRPFHTKSVTASFEDQLSGLSIGTIIQVTVGSGFAAKHLRLAKASDGWHIIDGYGGAVGRSGNTLTGALRPEPFNIFEADITGAELLLEGIKPGQKVTNKFQFDCMPEDSEVHRHDPAGFTPDKTLVKKGGKWGEPGGTFFDSVYYTFDGTFEYTWAGAGKTAAYHQRGEGPVPMSLRSAVKSKGMSATAVASPEIACFDGMRITAESGRRESPHISVAINGSKLNVEIPTGHPVDSLTGQPVDSGQLGLSVQAKIRDWFEMSVPGTKRTVAALAYDQWLHARNGKPVEPIPSPNAIKHARLLRVASKMHLAFPEIARFDGISVQVYPVEHGVPHVHGVRAGNRISVAVPVYSLLEGHDPFTEKKMKEWLAMEVPTVDGTTRLVGDLAHDEWVRVHNEGDVNSYIPSPEEIEAIKKNAKVSSNRDLVDPKYYLLEKVEPLPNLRLKAYFKNGDVRVANIEEMRGNSHPWFKEAFKKFADVKMHPYYIYWEVFNNQIEIDGKDLWGAGELV